MRYEIELTKSARKEYLKLPKDIRTRIFDKLQELAYNPSDSHLDIKPIKGSHGYYRLRVGNYRIVYFLINSILVIEVIKIGHRKEVYK